MTDYTKLIERLGERYGVPDLSTDHLLRRRDRKRRNQRIAAGVVGIAVFVAAIWIVTSVSSLDRSETSVGPAGGVTGPAETGPTHPPFVGWDGTGLPPEGAAPSTPEGGELIADYNADLGPLLVFVYADGRVLWHDKFDEIIYERRLTPQGIKLVRSGAVSTFSLLLYATNALPAGTWADSAIRSYVPSRYEICGLDPSRIDVPPRAEALLRGKEDSSRPGACFVVTTEEARALDDILHDAGFDRIVGGGGDTGVVALTFDTSDRPGAITFHAILPHGERVPATPA